MGIYVIALYFGNSLGPIFTGVIAESWSPRENDTNGDWIADRAQREIGTGLPGPQPS
jgi:hypothetical protein